MSRRVVEVILIVAKEIDFFGGGLGGQDLVSHGGAVVDVWNNETLHCR